MLLQGRVQAYSSKVVVWVGLVSVLHNVDKALHLGSIQPELADELDLCFQCPSH